METGLLAFVAISAIVIVTPGQDTALTVRNTLAGGRSAGLATAAGVATGQLLWTIAAAAGVTAVLAASAPVFAVIRLAGAAYLAYLGLTALLSAWRGLRADHGARTADPGRPARRSFRQGVLSNLGNPKMVLFFSSLLPPFAPAGLPALVGMLVLGATFCTMTLTWLSAYAWVIARTGSYLRRSALRRWIEALTGVVLVALGLRLATEPMGAGR